MNSHNSKNLEAFFLHANALHAKRQLKDAEASYFQILSQDSRHLGALNGLGVLRLQQQKFADAVKYLRKAVKRDPSSADGHHKLGFALTGAEKFVDALQSYRRAVSLRPQFSEAHNNLGYTQYKLKHYEEALASLDRAITLNPSYADAHNNRGNTLAQLDRPVEAIAAYQSALAINPSYADARNNLVQILANQRIGSDADEVQLTVPLDASTMSAIGSLYLEAGEFTLARRMFTGASLLDDTSYETLLGLGHATRQLGEAAAARSIFEDMQRRGMNSVEVIIQLSHLPPSPNNISALAEIGNISTDHLDEEKRISLSFTRARLLHNIGQHLEAWSVLANVNSELWQRAANDHAREYKIEQASFEKLRAHSPQQADEDLTKITPLFILGSSRSGKSVLEALVSTLKGVDRGFESPLIGNLLGVIWGKRGLSADADEYAMSAEFRSLYFNTLSKMKFHGRVFTTTSPGHVRHAAWLADTLPNARFVLIKRNVDDTVLRMLMKRYQRGNYHTYDLKAAYAYVDWYNSMIDIFADKYPEISRVTTYENIVTNPDVAVQMVQNLCNLPTAASSLKIFSDDRDCSKPYRDLMKVTLASGKV